MSLAYRYVDDRVWVSYDKPDVKTFRLLTIPIVKETPKGYWVQQYFGKKRFCLNDARKKWAYRTKEDALQSYIIRKKREIERAERTLYNAKERLRKALELQNDNKRS